MDAYPTMLCHNVTMSFDDTGTVESSPLLDAAQALLSLAPPAAVNAKQQQPQTLCYPVMRSAGNGYRLAPSSPYHQPQYRYDSYSRELESHMSPKTVLVTTSHAPAILNLPRLLPNSQHTSTVSSCDSSLDGTHVSELSTDSNTQFYEGSVSLSLAQDEESLSPLHCFMRKYCVEAFSATAEDVSTPRYGKSHGRSIVVGQVGIQCKHCKHRPYSSRQERAVCFPSSLKNIYHSIETWQRRHSLVCGDIPSWAKLAMTDLMGKSRSGAGGRRQYWEESAKRLGMVDTSMGIRFIRSPCDATMVQETPCDITIEQVASQPLVCARDRDLVTSYLFTLLDQMETCYFSEQDRVGGRSKVKDCPIGYPGLQCKHCSGKAGFGRYFPVSIQALTSANSDRNIFNHIVKCRRCPPSIKDQLGQFLREQQNSKNRRGSRKLFFQCIWERMHQGR